MHEFDVGSMSCGHCVSHVTEALKALDDKAEVQIDLATRKVRVATTASRERAASAIEEAGYPTA